MRKALAWCAVVAAASVSAGCESGALFAKSSDSAAEAPYQVFGDIERLQFSKQVQVALPAKAAVADVTMDDSHQRRLVKAISVLAEDRATWTDVNSVFMLGRYLSKPELSFEDLRAAASAQQSDLLLVVRRTERVRSKPNPLCVLNLLILPIFFLRTQDVRTTFDVHAAVVDVRNGLVYTTHDDQAIQEFSATLTGEDAETREALDESWDRIVARMKSRLADKLRVVAGSR